jgi:(p)ppGpp synthase/HD superfamily hydrolase
MPDSQAPPAPPPLTHQFIEAVAYATKLHLGQARKGSGVPYVGHLLGVCSLVLEEAGGEDEAIAALLHDAGEDQGGEARLAEIRRLFGPDVESIVRACSDTLLQDKPNWRTRKEQYLVHLEHQPRSVLLVCLADKLFNARAILRDYLTEGEALWGRFTGDRDAQLWYYGSLSRVFRRRLRDVRMTDELSQIVAELEQACGTAEGPS